VIDWVKAPPLDPYPADTMTAHPASTLVNEPTNDDPRRDFEIAAVAQVPAPAPCGSLVDR